MLLVCGVKEKYSVEHANSTSRGHSWDFETWASWTVRVTTLKNEFKKIIPSIKPPHSTQYNFVKNHVSRLVLGLSISDDRLIVSPSSGQKVKRCAEVAPADVPTLCTNRRSDVFFFFLTQPTKPRQRIWSDNRDGKKRVLDSVKIQWS